MPEVVNMPTPIFETVKQAIADAYERSGYSPADMVGDLAVLIGMVIKTAPSEELKNRALALHESGLFIGAGATITEPDGN